VAQQAALAAVPAAAVATPAPIAPDVLPVVGLPGAERAAVTPVQHGAGSPAGPIAVVLLLLVVFAGISILKPGAQAEPDDDRLG
jgi:hypothetical protein